MNADLRYLLSTFDRRDRVLLGVVVLAQFAIAVTDLIGVAAVLPLMQTLTGVSVESGALGVLHDLVGSPPRARFTVILACILIAAFIAKAALSSYVLWRSSAIIVRLQTRTARRLLDHYLSESFLQHRTRNIGEVMTTSGHAVQQAHAGVLAGLLVLLSQGMSIILIAIFLLVVAPLPTLAAVTYFAIVLFVLQRLLGPANRRSGQEAQDAAWGVSHALIDALSGFREVRLHNAHQHFLNRFDRANSQQAQASRRANFLQQLPKAILEMTTMAAIAILVIVAVLSGNEAEALPTLSLFVAATIKILPMMVSITATIGMIKVGRAGLALVANSLRQSERAQAGRGAAARDDDEGRPALAEFAPIEIRDVSFGYPDASQPVLQDVDLTIPAGSSFALSGPSGSGKTTLVNIILGLIPPTSGAVTYDGVRTTDAGAKWHEVVAYVPQDVYLADDTLAGNIAFGLAPEERDETQVRRAAERALLGDLIRELPHGLDTMVGERGARLSGGQRQRVGVARALYREPRVLVLDEATSALDNETEHKVTRTMQSLHGEITTILVAHRLSSVRHVDQLAFLADGQVEAVGSFREVVDRSPRFARLVALGDLDATESEAS